MFASSSASRSPSWGQHGCVARERAGTYNAAAPASGVGVVARERAGTYDAAAQAPDRRERTGAAAAGDGSVAAVLGRLRDAVEALRHAQDLLAAVDLDGEDDQTLREAAVALHREANRQQAQTLRLLRAIDQRGAYAHDGAVTCAAWYRARTNLDAPAAARLLQGAKRLHHLPALAAAFRRGEVSLAHVTTVTTAAIPRRRAAIAELDATLTELACNAGPRDLRIALRAIADHVDPDGSDTPPLDDHGPDERRDLQLHPSVNGLWLLKGVLDPLAGEALATLLDALDQPEPADTPEPRRSPGQRRADHLDACVRHLLATGVAPTTHGVKPHILVTVDLLQLLGAATGDAARPPRLRHGGPVNIGAVRRLAWEASVTAVLTMGPWRVVNVGRTMRTLPAWLRAVLQVFHGHCRGPDCDRPVTWSDAHHVIAWNDGGDTDLNASIPVCRAHHGLLTTGTWQLSYDPDTATCTWTGPHGQIIETSPPDPVARPPLQAT